MVEKPDFFSGSFGERRRYSWSNRRLGPVVDRLYDLRLSFGNSASRISGLANEAPIQRVLIAAVEVPGRVSELATVLDTLCQTRHDVTVALAPIADQGKFCNINVALQNHDPASFDWLIVVDDDVVLPVDFLDNFLGLAMKAGLKICQPAHKFHSYASFSVTLRKLGSLVRTTRFVECGPVTAFHRDVFSLVLPFPDLRYAWGTDVGWADTALRHSIAMGIIDATPLRHVKPVGNVYKIADAIAEGRQYLAARNMSYLKSDLLRTVDVLPVLKREGKLLGGLRLKNLARQS